MIRWNETRASEYSGRWRGTYSAGEIQLQSPVAVLQSPCPEHGMNSLLRTREYDSVSGTITSRAAHNGCSWHEWRTWMRATCTALRLQAWGSPSAST